MGRPLDRSACWCSRHEPHLPRHGSTVGQDETTISDNAPPESSIILYQTKDGRTRIECRFGSDALWLTQALIAELFQVAVPTVNEHLKGIFAEGEQAPGRTILNFRIVRPEGSRKVARDIEHYSLPAVAAVVVSALCAAGVSACQSRPKGAAPKAAQLVAQAPAADRSAPSLQDLKNATYRDVEKAGTEWVLRAWTWDEPAPATPEVTVKFDGARLAGHAGCNSYFAQLKPGDQPGDLTIGPAGATRMMCPEPAMTVATRFLQQLGGVTQVRFMAGQLALPYANTDKTFGVMLFDRRPIQ